MIEIAAGFRSEQNDELMQEQECETPPPQFNIMLHFIYLIYSFIYLFFYSQSGLYMFRLFVYLIYYYLKMAKQGICIFV